MIDPLYEQRTFEALAPTISKEVKKETSRVKLALARVRLESNAGKVAHKALSGRVLNRRILKNTRPVGVKIEFAEAQKNEPKNFFHNNITQEIERNMFL